MATAATIKKNIAKLEAALKSKATPKSLKSKLEAQLVKSKAELSGINKGTKPKTSTTKSTQTALQKLKDMVNKNKKLKTYKGAGVDLEKDADRPALPTGRRTAKQSGKTYYEYRANRIDVKQPPKRYPKLEKGGYMAKGGVSEKPIPAIMDKYGNVKSEKLLEQELEYLKEAYEDKLVTKDEYEKSYNEIKEQIKFLQKKEKGGYMAKGGEVDRERMYNFLKDDLAALEKAIEVNNQEEINDIFLYWNRHLKDLEPKTGSKRMYEFLKDDLVGLEAATKDLPSSKEETDRFFSYWNIHLKSLEPEKNKMAKGGYYAEGGSIEKQNNDMLKSTIVEMKHHVDELKSVVSNNTEVEPWVIAKAERASTDLSDITHYLEGEKQKGLEMPFEKGGYMAEGGETAKFQVDDVVYHKDFNTIGIVRIGEQLGTVKTDADGNVDVDELEYYNPLKHEAHKNAQIAPSTRKEIEERMLWKPFGERTSKLAKGGYFAKGGLTEHGLKVGDTIVDDMFWDKSVKVLNSKTGYAVVKIETGERKEMKAMGGEMHRTQE